MTRTRVTLDKRVSHAFGKDCYLLGHKKGEGNIWLEAASWDCGWYWGFGYVEIYTNSDNPDLAKDIRSHSHWSGLIGKQESYDHDKGCFILGDKYIHHLNDNPELDATVLTDDESWELADLMQTFYTLKSVAEVYHLGNSHLTGSGKLDLKDQKQEDYINQVLLPKVFSRVYEILSPTS